jgi:hypothetical protein
MFPSLQKHGQPLAIVAVCHAASHPFPELAGHHEMPSNTSVSKCIPKD